MREKLISVWEVNLTSEEQNRFIYDARFSKMPAFHGI